MLLSRHLNSLVVVVNTYECLRAVSVLGSVHCVPGTYAACV